MFKRIACLFASAFLCLAVGSPVYANPVELVTNGGFENFTGIDIGDTPPGTFNSPDGWDFDLPGGSGQFSGVNQTTKFGFPAVPHDSGGNAFDFGTLPPATGVLSQNLVTTPGQTYTFGFWVANDFVSDPANEPAIDGFTAVWSDSIFPDVTLLSLSDNQGMPYTHFAYDVTAQSTSVDIVFSGFNDTLWWHLDDVSVTAVPEPASILLLLTGGAGLLAFRKRIKS